MSNVIPKHKITEELFRSNRTIIYRALRDRDQTRVIIKTLNNEYPSNADLTRLKHEFHVIQKMVGAGLVHAYEQVKYGNNLALVLEDFQGVSLHDYLSKVGKIDWGQCLRLAIEIGRGVGHIHQQNVIHK
ncbi:MAG: protein kinase, partial [Deltaproteobacteria bacterium]|nr:protein kinase [Deltaproteobacteria bacterium]